MHTMRVIVSEKLYIEMWWNKVTEVKHEHFTVGHYTQAA